MYLFKLVPAPKKMQNKTTYYNPLPVAAAASTSLVLPRPCQLSTAATASPKHLPRPQLLFHTTGAGICFWQQPLAEPPPTAAATPTATVIKCRPLPPLNVATLQLPPSNNIFATMASSLPCCHPSPSQSNSVRCYRGHRMSPPTADGGSCSGRL